MDTRPLTLQWFSERAANKGKAVTATLAHRNPRGLHQTAKIEGLDARAETGELNSSIDEAYLYNSY